MNISEPPPFLSDQASFETGSGCSSVSFFSRSAWKDEVGGHQLGQRRRVGRGVGVALGERLARRQVEDDVALGGDLGRLRRLRGGDGGDGEQEGGGERARRGTGKKHGHGKSVR
jgi:hypothetical protein